jgi:hypothetical protein
MEKREIIIKIREMFPELLAEDPNFSSLVSREAGLEVRLKIEEELEKNKDTIIILDFEGLELITQGFADEIVGVLIRRKGIDFVRKQIKAINMHEFIRGTLNWVVSYSKKMALENKENQ